MYSTEIQTHDQYQQKIFFGWVSVLLDNMNVRVCARGCVCVAVFGRTERIFWCSV